MSEKKLTKTEARQAAEREARQKYLALRYAADAPAGRLLLALRAGRISAEDLQDRFAESFSSMRQTALKDKFIEKREGYYYLTEAGRAACPSRRSLCQKTAVSAAENADEKKPPLAALQGPVVCSISEVILHE